MPVLDPESLYPLQIPTAVQFVCQRGCKELDRQEKRITAARLFRQTWYDPATVSNS